MEVAGAAFPITPLLATCTKIVILFNEISDRTSSNKYENTRMTNASPLSPGNKQQKNNAIIRSASPSDQSGHHLSQSHNKNIGVLGSIHTKEDNGLVRGYTEDAMSLPDIVESTGNGVNVNGIAGQAATNTTANGDQSCSESSEEDDNSQPT